MQASITILGAGWLGLPLGVKLLGQGYFVKGSTTTAAKLPLLAAAGLEPYLLRAHAQLDADDWISFLRSDVIFLNLPPGRRDPQVVTSYPATIKALSQIIQAHHPLPRIIFASSTSVYGDHGQIATEYDALEPTTSSGQALVAAEQILQAAAPEHLTILRFAGLVGPERPAGRFFAGKNDLPGGDSPVNLVHQEDCLGIIAAVLAQNAWGQVFNVCADAHPRKGDFYPQQALRQGYPPPSFSPGQPESWKIISNERCKKILHYRFNHPDPQYFPV